MAAPKTEAVKPAESPAATEAEQPEVAQATPEKETPTEAAPEDKPEAEAEAEADEALSKSTSLTPEQQAIIDKRIGKAVAKQRRAERDAAELKVQLAEMQARATAPAQTPQEQPSIVPLPNGVQPLSNIDTVQGLVKLESEAKQAIRFAEDAIEDIRDGGQPPEGWTKQALREVLRNAKVTLEDQIPNRREFLNTRNQMQQKAYEVLPFLKDQASSEYKAAQAIYQRHPFLRNIPEGDFTVGLIVEGIKAVEARTAAAKAAPASAKAPEKKAVISKPVPSGDQTAVSTDGSPGRVPANTARERAQAEARAKLNQKGGVSQGDYAAFLSRQSQLRNSA